jgi:FkbM family methyltransferase
MALRFPFQQFRLTSLCSIRQTTQEEAMQFGRYRLSMCRYGWMLYSGPFIGKCFELYGQYSESEVSVLRTLLKPGDTVLDVGANIGDLTVPISRFVGPNGRVYAIESHTDTYHALCANLALNGIQNVKALNCFIADTPDVDTSGPWGKFGYVSEIWGAPVVSIDSLNLSSCAFIKIDVDGKELEVLRSAQRLIETARPILYFENDNRATSSALLEDAMQRRYDLYWHPAPIFDANNYYGNPVNHWAPQNILSLMVLGIPSEKRDHYKIALKTVADKDDWWDRAFNIEV